MVQFLWKAKIPLVRGGEDRGVAVLESPKIVGPKLLQYLYVKTRKALK
jgi:hypothetical protein